MARRSRRSTRRKIGGGALEDARSAYKGNMKDDNIRQRLIDELNKELADPVSSEDKKALQIELEGVERGESLDLIYARLAYRGNMKDETIRQRLIDELNNEINNNSEKDTTALSKELEDLETPPPGALPSGAPLADGKPLQADGSTDEPQADGSSDEPQADGSSDDGTSDDGSSDGEPSPAGVGVGVGVGLGGRRRRKSRRSRRRRKSRRSRRRRKSRQSRRPRKSRRTRRSRRSRRH